MTGGILLLRLFGLLDLRHVEGRGVDRGRIQLDLLDGDALRAFLPLGAALDRHREEQSAADVLVVAVHGLTLDLLPLDLALRFRLDLEVGVGVEVNVGLDAVLGRDLQLVRGRALDVFLAEVLNLVALALVRAPPSPACRASRAAWRRTSTPPSAPPRGTCAAPRCAAPRRRACRSWWRSSWSGV